MPEEVVLGIDLGTSNISAYYKYENKQQQVIFPGGTQTMPSVVLYRKDKVSVGSGAFSSRFVAIKKYISNWKRIIGKSFNDSAVQDYIKTCPVEIIEKEGSPVYVLSFTNEKIYVTPTDVACAILKEIKVITEHFLNGKTINKVCISTPATFTTHQRNCIYEAACQADFKAILLTTEPVAAAISYAYTNNKINSNIVVYDFGGGTFDCCFLVCESNKYRVIGKDGNNHLGGVNIDQEIFKYVLNELRKYNNNEFTPIIDKFTLKQKNQLLTMCCDAKISLSYHDSYDIDLSDIRNDIEFCFTLTRQMMNQIIQPIINQTIQCIKRMLNDIHKMPTEIDKIILVGGSSQIPLVKETLTKEFSCEILCNLDPTSIVSKGALLMGCLWNDMELQESDSSQILKQEVSSNPRNSHSIPKRGIEPKKDKNNTIYSFDYQVEEYMNSSIGICIGENTCRPIIKKGSRYCEMYNIGISIIHDNVMDITIQFCQGNHEEFDKNEYLGALTYQLSEPRKNEDPQFVLHTFVNSSGLLKCELEDLTLKKTNMLSLSSCTGSSSIQYAVNGNIEETFYLFFYIDYFVCYVTRPKSFTVQSDYLGKNAVTCLRMHFVSLLQSRWV